MQINRYFCGTKIKNRKVYCFFVLVSIGVFDMYYIFIWRSHVSAHQLILLLFLPNGLVEMEVLIYLNQHISLSLVKQDASIAILQTSIISHPNLPLSVKLLRICLLLHSKSPTSKVKVANYLPSPFFLSCFQPTAATLTS